MTIDEEIEEYLYPSYKSQYEITREALAKFFEHKWPGSKVECTEKGFTVTAIEPDCNYIVAEVKEMLNYSPKEDPDNNKPGLSHWLQD